MIATLVLVLWIIWDNERIVVSFYEVKSVRLPEEFKGYRIVQISDLHNDELGKENEKLLTLIKDAKPDIIAITGDLLDSRRTNVEKASDFIENAMKIAPCYYVTGNHESRINKEYKKLEEEMREAGVGILRNDRVVLKKNGAQIVIAGIDDPRFVTDTDCVPKMSTVIGEILSGVLEGVPKDAFTILLSHRPELFKLYCEQEIDLVLAGHVHGGQVRIPYVGGIIGPGQGLLPDYDAGVYEADATSMVLSRGLGQSIIPFRVNNPPELVVVELKKERITE